MLEIPKRAVIFFKKKDCERCKEVSYFVNRLELDIPIVEVEREENPELLNEFAITAVPVVLIIDEGVEYERLYGVRKLQNIDEIISEM